MKSTLSYKGVVFDVIYLYQPAEKAVYYPVDKAYPGSPEMVMLNEITHAGESFMEFFENEIEEIENLILEKHGNN